MKKQTLYPLLLALGAGILLFRTVRLLTLEHGWTVLTHWVIGLTLLEMAIDTLCILNALHWMRRHSAGARSRALRQGAIAALLHALRVLIFVLGRIGPWVNFDVKPQYRSGHVVDMFWVYFAATLSVLGVLGVVIIWRHLKKRGARASSREGEA